MKHLLRPVVIALAVVYFLIDALFLTFIHPFADWLGRLPIFPRLRAWVIRQDRYTSLLLFLVPLILLEPVKPVAFFLMAKHHFVSGCLVLAMGELVKITLVERLFHLTRLKLLTFPWFARAYNYLRAIVDHVKKSPMWLAMAHTMQTIKTFLRRTPSG
jgi:hypothetical protein